MKIAELHQFPFGGTFDYVSNWIQKTELRREMDVCWKLFVAADLKTTKQRGPKVHRALMVTFVGVSNKRPKPTYLGLKFKLQIL